MLLTTPKHADLEPLDPDTVDWLLLDLNSYFASVEQELRPELRGKPIAVVPVVADTTVAIAASYEAKAFGVKTGVRVSDAKLMCPGLILVEGRHELYVDYHHKIVEAVESCLPVAAVLSIDEMACRLIGTERRIERALEIATSIKAAVRSVGETLRCSVGLAPNRYLAKIASDMQKPDGLTLLRRNELPGSLAHLEPMDLPGVGRRMNERLQNQGIRTMQQILDLSPEDMHRVWGGITGERLWHLLRGTDYDDLREDQKSIGHSHVLSPEMRSDETAYAVCQKLLQKAGTRLRTMQMWAGAIELTIKYAPPSARAQAQPKIQAFDVPERPAPQARTGSTDQNGNFIKFAWHERLQTVECQDALTLVEALKQLWSKRPVERARRERVHPYFVGVTLLELVPDNLHSLDLFGDSRRAQLSKTLDRINQKYGSQTLYFAGMHLARESAPTRIAFQSIPDLF